MNRARLGPSDRLPQALPQRGPPAPGQGSAVGRLVYGPDVLGGGRTLRDQVPQPSTALFYT